MIYACPKCHSAELIPDENQDILLCKNSDCEQKFPIVDGRPILICENRSLFSFDDYTAKGGITTMDLRVDRDENVFRKIANRMKRLIPDKSYPIGDYSPAAFVGEIAKTVANPHILAIGAGEAQLAPLPGVKIIYTDVALGPLTDAIADAHDLPFSDEVFDVVIAEAVLEHVLEPFRVVQEITRVLKTGGGIYSNTPFMQQVHMGRYDFTRFTHLGHRMLWKQFDEFKSGVSNGAGMAVIWSIEYFIRTVCRSSRMESLIGYPVRFLTLPFRLADKYSSRSAGIYDAASAYYFTGFKREFPLPAKQLVQTYKGKQQ